MNSFAAIPISFVIVLTMVTACSQMPRDAERGRKLIEQHQCGTCHSIPGVNGAHGQVAVTLQSFGLRSYIAGRVPNSDENLVRWIQEPAALVPGTLMPDMGVTSIDARAIAAYLRELR